MAEVMPTNISSDCLKKGLRARASVRVGLVFRFQEAILTNILQLRDRFGKIIGLLGDFIW